MARPDADPDFAFDHAPGLPAPLPRGEMILWQGRPSVWRLALEAAWLDWVLGYFALVVAWRAAVGYEAAGLPGALAFGLPYLGLAALAAAVILALAWAMARATLYTVTTGRVVMRVGAVLPLTLNLPYSRLASAALDTRRGGTGTLALSTTEPTGLGYLALWPHVRPWRIGTVEPALRCIPDAAWVAQRLADAAETRVTGPQLAGPAAPAAASSVPAAPAAATIAAE